MPAHEATSGRLPLPGLKWQSPDLEGGRDLHLDFLVLEVEVEGPCDPFPEFVLD